MEILGSLLKEEGFEVIVIKNPRTADSLLAPRIEDTFANNNIIIGDNPLMHWYTNNMFVKTNSDENKHYLRKEEVPRKTDGFKCFMCGMRCAKELEEKFDIDESFDMLDEIKF